MEKNDCLRLTKGYLRDIEYYRVAATNLQDTISELTENLRDVSTKIASYEQNPGGNSELTAVERESSKRMEMQDEQMKALKSLHELQKILTKVDRGLEHLTDEERNALMYYYAEKKSYLEIADRQNISERSCRRRVRDATRKMALMMFGLKSTEKVMFLC